MNGLASAPHKADAVRPAHLRTRIYLDYDGTVGRLPYPENGDCLEHLSSLQAILRSFPRVDVVISSSWRHTRSLEQLRQLYDEDLRNRIIGSTPWLLGKKRVVEIRAHRRETGHTGRFLVLDDIPGEFPRHWPPLLLCDSAAGLNKVKQVELVARLQLLP